MKFGFTLLVAFIIAGITGCNLVFAPSAPTITPRAAPSLEFAITTPTSLPTPTLVPIPPTNAPPPAGQSPQQAVLDQAFIIVRALKEKDFDAVASYVSPKMGLHISPYASVKDTEQVFPADKVPSLLADNSAYLWGVYDGSGKPINLSFIDYYAKFIYDEDYASAPQLALNFRLGVSTTLDNSAEYFPGAMIVEFHFPGADAGLAGMDWRSLRLVFMQEGSAWYLVGIIHDNWTT